MPRMYDAQRTFLRPDGESMDSIGEWTSIVSHMVLPGIYVDKHSQGVVENLTHLVQLAEVVLCLVRRRPSLKGKHREVVLANCFAALFDGNMEDNVRTLGHVMAPALLVFHLQDDPIPQSVSEKSTTGQRPGLGVPGV
jgi:hypothetical protein